jgi:glyoxylase-like metal-dependent hydrolase (beta-lactamase superfamily II)
MQIFTIDAGHFKLDGGAMFGVVPKTIWNKTNPADENNLCSWNMRCLLIENEGKLILIDTGMGDKQDAKFQGFYYKHGEGNLIESIKKAGFSPNEVTDVILSHLHFDHCGGAVSWNSDRTKFNLTFPNANYWTHSEHWQSAIEPNNREKATFLKENILPIQETNQLNFIDKNPNYFGENFEILTADGHTEKMLMPKIIYNNQTICFLADTIPSISHLPLPYVMGYDLRPLQTMIEKEAILKQAFVENWLLFFDHDPSIDCCTLQNTEKGIRALNKGKLHEFI